MSNPEREAPGSICTPDAHSHCVTCADEAQPAQVGQIDHAAGLALVRIGAAELEVDISLLDAVAAGDTVLVHGGVALANLGHQ